MNFIFKFYYLIVFTSLTIWAIVSYPNLKEFLAFNNFFDLSNMSIFLIYIFSHILRMFRLVLLTLDNREKSVPLVFAHNLTSFLSVFIPFKLGEILRFSAISYVCASQKKANAIWILERFGDISVITLFIIFLYLLNLNIPTSMQTIFIVFVITWFFSLLSLFSISKLLIFLKRNLFLTSLSERSLIILKISDKFRNIEKQIYKTIEGRFTGFCLLSFLIWGMEITSLSIFLNSLSDNSMDFAELFSKSIFSTFIGESVSDYIFYQHFALFIISSISLIYLLISNRITIIKSN